MGDYDGAYVTVIAQDMFLAYNKDHCLFQKQYNFLRDQLPVIKTYT